MANGTPSSQGELEATSSHVEARLSSDLQHICVEIGTRPAGSNASRRTVDRIQSAFVEAGLDVELQRIPGRDWHAEAASLRLDGDSLEVAANVFSPPCDLTAPTTAAGTLAELRAADLGGRIALLHGALTLTPITPKGCLLYEIPRDSEVIRLLEEKRPAAVITINQNISRTLPLIEDWAMEIPSATVPAEVGRLLLEETGREVSLQISTKIVPSESITVIGRRRAAAAEPHIVLCAHHDTKIDTPGAVDNGGGAVALLELARQLGRRELGISLEFVAFSGEEYGIGQDDAEYVSRQGDRFQSTLAAINLDGIGRKVGVNTIASYAASEQFQAGLDGLLRSYPGVEAVDPWPQSNHSTFSFRGIPAVALSSTGAWTDAHTQADSADWVSIAKLNEAVRLVVDIVEMLRDKPLGWTRPSPQGDAER